MAAKPRLRGAASVTGALTSVLEALFVDDSWLLMGQDLPRTGVARHDCDSDVGVLRGTGKSVEATGVLRKLVISEGHARAWTRQFLEENARRHSARASRFAT